MKTKEEIYSEYSDNPIKWMQDNNCATTKEVTLKLMEAYHEDKTRLYSESDLQNDEKHFIVSALNHYWYDATTNLGRKDLGDLEKEMYLKQQSRAKEIMKRVEDSIYKK